MKLKIIAINDKGDLEKEVVWLEAVENCDLKHYLICDSTYTDETHISNELRHMYWFAPQIVTKGDLIALFTKAGANHDVSNNRQTTTYFRYWKLGKTVWNKAGDAAVLFELENWNTTRAL